MNTLLIIIKNLLRINSVPFGVIHFVTSACNLKCAHCFIYGNFDRKIDDLRFQADALSLEEIKQMTRSMKHQLQVASLTGGEPFLRPDLLQIALLYVQNAGAQLIEVSTNGWFTDRLRHFVEAFLRTTDAHLYFSLSFDGMRETHDRIRSVPGAFDRAVESAKYLLSLKQDRLTVGATISVGDQSTEELETLFNFLTDHVKINSVATAALRGEPKVQNKISFNEAGYRRLNDLIQERILDKSLSLFSRRFGSGLINARGIVTRNLIQRMLSEGKFISPCTAGRTLAIIYSNGSVYPCEMLPLKLGRLQEFGMNFRALMQSKVAREIRKQIRADKCFCTFECAYHFNVIFELANWPALLKKYLDIKIGKSRKKTAGGTNGALPYSLRRNA